MINHLDKIKFMSENKMLPRVIIRTSVGQKNLLMGDRHTADYTEAIKKWLLVDIVTLDEPGEIFPAFKDALESSNVKSTLLIEKGSHYNDK